jgi:hypothetical protein
LPPIIEYGALRTLVAVEKLTKYESCGEIAAIYLLCYMVLIWSL